MQPCRHCRSHSQDRGCPSFRETPRKSSLPATSTVNHSKTIKEGRTSLRKDRHGQSWEASPHSRTKNARRAQDSKVEATQHPSMIPQHGIPPPPPRSRTILLTDGCNSINSNRGKTAHTKTISQHNRGTDNKCRLKLRGLRPYMPYIAPTQLFCIRNCCSIKWQYFVSGFSQHLLTCREMLDLVRRPGCIILCTNPLRF